MAYAAYREALGVTRTPAASRRRFEVLDVIVPCTQGYAVRRALAGCEGVGVLRCVPLIHAGASAETDAPRIRLTVLLPHERYAELLCCLLRCVPNGEIGQLISWREHLARNGLPHG